MTTATAKRIETIVEDALNLWTESDEAIRADLDGGFLQIARGADGDVRIVIFDNHDEPTAEFRVTVERTN